MNAGGTAMLGAASEAAGDDLELLAVTLLTHLGPEDLAELDLPGRALQRAERWATLAQGAGCKGAVCSPLEVARLRELLPSPFRSCWRAASNWDQSRAVTGDTSIAWVTRSSPAARISVS